MGRDVFLVCGQLYLGWFAYAFNCYYRAPDVFLQQGSVVCFVTVIPCFDLLSVLFRRPFPAELRHFVLNQLRLAVLLRLDGGVKGFELPLPVFRQGETSLFRRIRYIRAICLGLPGVAWWAMG